MLFFFFLVVWIGGYVFFLFVWLLFLWVIVVDVNLLWVVVGGWLVLVVFGAV